MHAWLYRLTGGKVGGRMRDFRVGLLTTTGRKSGKGRTTPLGFFDYKNGYLVVASNAGLSSHPAWYYNLKSNPHVTVQMLERVTPATAEILFGEDLEQAWRLVLSRAPSYASYGQRTKREIPLVLLHPDQ